MKLTEIYGDPVSIRTGQQTRQFIRHPEKMDSVLGIGAYGYVKNNPVDPHLVAKRNLHADKLEHDPYYRYLSYLMEHNLIDENIHFPRIYNIQLTPTMTTSVSHLYRVDMERLISYKEASEEELEALLEYTFVDVHPAADRVDSAYDMIISAMKRYYEHRENSSVFKDTALVSAMNTVLEIVSTQTYQTKYGPHVFYLDTKKDNYMLRRTPTGLQIVFSDPIS